MQYAPTLMDEKGACFLSAIGRGRGELGGGGLLLFVGKMKIVDV